jgi:homospermidine synthase
MYHKLIILGNGAVGSCVLDCIIHGVLPLKFTGIILVDKKTRPRTVPDNVTYMQANLTKSQFKRSLDILSINEGDIVIDLLSGGGSLDIINYVCVQRKARYIGSSLDDWNYEVGSLSSVVKKVMLKRKKWKTEPGSNTATAVLTHGMNPGLVNHFAILAAERLDPKERKDITHVHITEVDTQGPKDSKAKLKTFTTKVQKHVKNYKKDTNTGKPVVTTWAPQNYLYEMSWGPSYGRGDKAIYMRTPSYKTRQKSIIYDPQTEKMRQFTGMIVEHEEPFTIQHHFNKHGWGNASTEYKFVYLPCDLCQKSLGMDEPLKQEGGARAGLLMRGGNMMKGHDTVGTLVKTATKAVWVGNACAANFTPDAALDNKTHNATVYQVAAGVISGLVFAMENPKAGMVFPEDMTSEQRNKVLNTAELFMGKVIGFTM